MNVLEDGSADSPQTLYLIFSRLTNKCLDPIFFEAVLNNLVQEESLCARYWTSVSEIDKIVCFENHDMRVNGDSSSHLLMNL